MSVSSAVVPIFHSYGLTAALNVPVSLGAALVLKASFQIADVMKGIRTYRPTIFPGVPIHVSGDQQFPRCA